MAPTFRDFLRAVSPLASEADKDEIRAARQFLAAVPWAPCVRHAGPRASSQIGHRADCSSALCSGPSARTCCPFTSSRDRVCRGPIADPLPLARLPGGVRPTAGGSALKTPGSSHMITRAREEVKLHQTSEEAGRRCLGKVTRAY